MCIRDRVERVKCLLIAYRGGRDTHDSSAAFSKFVSYLKRYFGFRDSHASGRSLLLISIPLSWLMAIPALFVVQLIAILGAHALAR